MQFVYLKIARKEFAEVARDGRFRWAFGAVFALLAASLLLGWRHPPANRGGAGRAA